MTVDDHQIEHFRARIHLDAAEANLPAQRLVRAQQQLLARLPTRVKRPRYLRAAK